MKRRWTIGAIGLASLLASTVAHAQAYCPATPPACNDATAIPNPIYVNAADTQVPSLHKLGKQLRAQVDGSGTPTPITIVYVPNGSCTNLANLYASPPKFTVGSAGGPFFIPADPTFDVTAKTACPCQIPTGTALQPDLAITIVNPDNLSCPSNPATPPAGIGVFKGPVQGMTFVVPYDSTNNVGSSQRAITAEEAYLVMGLGAEMAQVPPWDDSNFIFGRPASKGTQISIGANIQVPAAKWKLVMANMIDQSSTLASTVAGLAADPNAEKVLGILGTEIYDKNRGKLHALAFRAFQQMLAYWPDSTLNATDKQNLRDGHYVLWSYVQYLAPVSGTPAVAKAPVQEIIDALTGKLTSVTYKSSANSVTSDPIDNVITSGLVPICAMKVQRAGAEGSDLSLYTPDQPCGCYFDKKATQSTSCTACTDNSVCNGGMCRRGYCEAN
jgi:hypothetical protein